MDECRKILKTVRDLRETQPGLQIKEIEMDLAMYTSLKGPKNVALSHIAGVPVRIVAAVPESPYSGNGWSLTVSVDEVLL
jgi:hypothetical protein